MKNSTELRINWLAGRNELWIGSRLVMRFVSLSPDQVKILSGFQHSHWPETIRSPFRRSKAKKKSRLKDTVKSLNQILSNPTILQFDTSTVDDREWIAHKTFVKLRRVPAKTKTPFWDAYRGNLHWNGKLLKHYRWLAPNIAWVLAAFQKRGWPTEINDPLPPTDVNPKVRLHDTIKFLNRGLNPKRIRFKGDGTGEGVFWEKC